MPPIDHFGLIAPFYDRVFQTGERELLIELLDNPENGVLLDVGGGTGRVSQLFSDKFDQIVVVDLSLEMLEQAILKGNLQVTCSHSEKLPYDDEIFDRIIMIDALHHVCDQRETAAELFRVLKTGGRIVIEEPDVRKFGIKILALLEKILGMRSQFLAPPRIAALFNSGAEIRIETNGAISWVVIMK